MVICTPWSLANCAKHPLFTTHSRHTYSSSSLDFNRTKLRMYTLSLSTHSPLEHVFDIQLRAFCCTQRDVLYYYETRGVIASFARIYELKSSSSSFLREKIATPHMYNNIAHNIAKKPANAAPATFRTVVCVWVSVWISRAWDMRRNQDL